MHVMNYSRAVYIMSVNLCRQLLMSCMCSEIITSRTIASNMHIRSRLMYRKNWRKRWSSLMKLQAGILNTLNLYYFYCVIVH